MQKLIHLVIVMLLTNSILGQPVNEKLLTIPQIKYQSPESLTGFSDLKSKKEIINPQKQISDISRLKSTFSEKEKLDSIVSERWDTITCQWIVYSKSEFNYDTDGNMTLEIEYDRDDHSGQWILSDKQVFTYDSLGNFFSIEHTGWDEITMAWIDASRTEYTYDSNGNYIQIVMSDQQENKSEWIFSYKSEYQYDEHGNMILGLSYEWDENSGLWILSGKADYHHDANGNDTLSIAYFISKDTIMMIAQSKAIYAYNDSGYLTSSSYFSWNENDSLWMPTSKYEVLYDTLGNISLEYSYEWDQDSMQWMADIKNEYGYDLSCSSGDLFLPFYYYSLGYFNYKLKYSIEYQYDVAEWDFYSKSTLFYSPTNKTFSGDSHQLNGVLLYPNPATDHIIFKHNGTTGSYMLELFDMRGSKVMSQKIESGVPVSVQSLPKGIYIYRLNKNEMVNQGKLIIY